MAEEILRSLINDCIDLGITYSCRSKYELLKELYDIMVIDLDEEDKKLIQIRIDSYRLIPNYKFNHVSYDLSCGDYVVYGDKVYILKCIQGNYAILMIPHRQTDIVWAKLSTLQYKLEKIELNV